MATVASGNGGRTNLPFLFSRTQLYTKPTSLYYYSHHNCKPFSSTHSNQNQISSTVADKVLGDILNSGIIACLRAQSAEVAIEAARAAISGGISVLEVVMNTPGVFEVLRYLVREYPSMSIGVGTVLSRRDARAAIKLGAKFLVSPAIVKDILDDVVDGQALYIPGVLTPTEILFASNAGAKIVKIYPVSALGGVQYIAALTKPFSQIPMVASQGITLDLISSYIAQGASSVVLSDAIFDKTAMDQLYFERINQLASRAAFEGNEAIRRASFLSAIVVFRALNTFTYTGENGKLLSQVSR